jgi:hypothetical protein
MLRPIELPLSIAHNSPNLITYGKGNVMSGSGGGGYGGGFDSTDACDTLVIDTQLSSPKDDVVSAINVGDVLEVELRQYGATVVVVALHNGAIAGGIAAPQVPKLRECIQGGTTYVAKVTAKNEGQVKVRISPVRQ